MLKAGHYKFIRFLEGTKIRLGIGEALVAAAKISVDIQIEDPEVPIGDTVEALIEDSSKEHKASQQGVTGSSMDDMLHGLGTLSSVVDEVVMVKFSYE